MKCRGCEQLGDICPACERAAEARAEARRDVEPYTPDQFGREADWNYPPAWGDTW